ncbi:U-box domain-containing protein 33-like [Carex rostrata]
MQRDDRTSYTAEYENEHNNTHNANEERPALQLELSEAQKLIEQLMSERDYARKQVEELRQLTEQQAPGSQAVGYFAGYSYSELQDATNNFHESLKLGEGGFGIVYKGILHNTNIAIKILKEGSSQGATEFHQEIEILSKVRHPNLVTLIGACAETRALIYEYLPNGSLEDNLRSRNNTSPLSWQTRTRIAFEICSALSFLHSSKPHGIVHGDLKPDNILLDFNNVSKISDFGLCRQLNLTDSASVPFQLTDSLKGTLAYMDPEYFSTGKITPLFDVYSFGIMLLRLVTCKDPRGIRNLVEAAQKKDTLKALIDASAGPWSFKEAKKMISLGLRCSDPMRKNRPDLSTKVWNELKSMADLASASMSS